MAQKRVPLLIRIEPKLKAELTELAKAEHRSLNQQIEYLLSHAVGEFTGSDSKTGPQSKRERGH